MHQPGDLLNEGKDLVVDASSRAARTGRFELCGYDFSAPMDTLKERMALEETHRSGNRP
jgi:hypothetical protein